MQVEIHLDFETYSEADLTSCGAHAYARDPSTDCLVARWRVKLGGSWLKPGEWRPGDDYPFEKYFDEDLVIYAWNSQFERLIWRHVMTPVYGWPELKLKQFICVSAWARSVAAAPAKLETAAAFFGQPAQKDMGGHRHMLTMCRPATESQQLKWLRGAVDRLGRDVDHEEAKRCHHTREAIDKLSGYCAKDVEAEIDIAEILPPFPETELQCFWENERINDRGLIVDLDFAEAAVSLVEIEQAYFERELARLTNGQIETVKQYQRHSAWVSEQLDERGVKMMTVYRDGKPKLSVASDIRSNLLAEDDLNPGFLPVHVRDVLEIIDQGSKAATSKFEGMLSRAVKDDEGNWRVHGLYMFAGAAQTGRYSSTGLQVHNLVRDVPKEAGDMIDWCIDGHQRGTLFNEFRAIVDQWAAAQKGKKQFVGRAKGKTQEANDYRGGQGGATTGANAGFVKGPIHALAACVRPAFTGCPRGRFKLVWGDWSSIEARTLPWLSLHQDADDLLARYRRNEDVYRYQAGKHLGKSPDAVEDWERQAYGKVPILSLGYGGGEGAFAAMARAYGVSMDEGERRGIVGDWRDQNHWATNFWVRTEDAAMWAMKKPGSSYGAGRLSYRFDPDALDGLGALFCQLPSGRELCYPEPSIDVIRKPWGQEGLGITARKGAWKPKAGEEAHWPRVTLWYGLLVENATQATCADILNTAIMRAKRRSWDLLVVGHTHDELLVESEQPEEDAPILQELMETRPGWPGDDALPLNAEVKFGYRYKAG